MYLTEKRPENVGAGHKAFHEAARHGTVLSKESTYVYPSRSGKDGANLSGIITKLIQITGRFCERYASDLMYDLSDVCAFERLDYHEDPREWAIVIGIREDGVDHEGFVLSALRQRADSIFGFAEVERHYRKLLVVIVKDSVDDKYGGCMDRKIKLVDITHQPIRLKDIEEEE